MVRLISLHVYKYNDEDSKLLAKAMDLSICRFYERGVAKQMINFNSRLVSGRIPPGNRSVVALENNAAKCYCYCTNDGISATAITDNDYPEQSAYIMLNSLVMEFRDNYASDPSVYEDAMMDIDQMIKPDFDTIG